MEQLVEKVKEQVKVSETEKESPLYTRKGFELRCKGWCHDAQTTYHAKAELPNPEYFSYN